MAQYKRGDETAQLQMTESNLKTSPETKASKPPAKPSRVRRVLKWLGIGTLAIIVVAALIAAYIWKNRYALLEDRAIAEFKAMGIEAALSIEHIGMNGAAIKDVKLSADGKLFFSAARAEFEYLGAEVLDGKFEKMRFEKPFIHIKLDGNGKIIDGWAPDSSTGGGGFQIPPEGIFIDDGTLDFITPWASGKAGIDAEFLSPANWNAHINANGLRVDAGEIAANVNIKGVVESQDETHFTMIGDMTAGDIKSQSATARALDTTFNFAVARNVQAGGNTFHTITGWTHLDANTLQIPEIDIQSIAAKLNIEAKLNAAESKLIGANIGWDIDGGGLSVVNPVTRTQWERAVIPYDVMAKTPIAKYFSEYFAKKSNALMQDFTVKGQGALEYTQAGYRLDWDGPLVIAGNYQEKPQSLSLKPRPDKTEIKFNKAASALTAEMDVDWSGGRALEIYGVLLDGQSASGLGMNGTERVTAHIRSTAPWTATARENGKTTQARLAPFDVNFSYVNADRRTVKLAGVIDYDGFLPGGTAKHLRAAGRVGVDLKDSGFVLGFVPSGKIDIANFESHTGWTGTDLSFGTANTGVFFNTSVRGEPMTLSLTEFKGKVISPDQDKHMDTAIERIDIRTEFASTPQVWKLDLSGANLRSDDFPAPGTVITSASSNLNVTQYGDGSIEFTLDAPKASVDTDLVRVRDLEIALGGSPDDITARYRAGRVRFSAKDPAGNDLPVLAFPGTARLVGGVLTGRANAVMPLTKDTPIDINFRTENGLAEVGVDIPVIRFVPGGLQPQALVSSLKGKLAAVSGEASAHFDFSFGGGGPIRSSGRASMTNMDVGTLVGPFAGINADLEFSSILPLVTKGVQRASIQTVDPGFPLKNGQFAFEIVKDGIRIDQAYWPVDNGPGKPAGRIYLDPVLWRFGNAENRITARVQDVALGTLLADLGKDSFAATGQINGQLPVVINGVNLLVENGILAVRDGGIIRFKTKQTDAAADANEQAGYAFKALENFEYKQLEARLNGPLDGEMALKVVFEGKNPDVLVGTPFEFNVEVVGELANIVRNTISAYQIKDDVGRALELRRAQEAADKAK